MQREIEFRGKRIDNGEWVYGYYLKNTDNETFICTELLGYVTCCCDCGAPDSEIYEVIPETVGQYTGLKDSKGQKIYEGDILKIYDEDIVTVVYYSGVFGFVGKYRELEPFDEYHMPSFMETIGNVIDNPELLKEE